MKVLNNSDDHVVAFGASFSTAADSHLVCLQNDDGQYQTQAINIQNRPRRGTSARLTLLNLDQTEALNEIQKAPADNIG